MVAVAATVNQEAEAPTTGGDEYTLWLEYINRGLAEWAEAYDWEGLRKTWFPTITGISVASVGLPLDFSKIGRMPILHVSSESEDKEFPLVPDQQRKNYSEDEEFFSLTGDTSSGLTMVFHPGTLASGASLEVGYFCTPTSLASPAEIPMVPDAQFLVDRTIAYIFESRSDPRFQIQEAKARDRLLMMVENASSSFYASYAGQNYLMTPEKKTNFRLGRD